MHQVRHQANADVNAAENIRRQDLDILARAGEPLGVPLETGPESPGWGEGFRQ